MILPICNGNNPAHRCKGAPDICLRDGRAGVTLRPRGVSAMSDYSTVAFTLFMLPALLGSAQRRPTELAPSDFVAQPAE